MNKVPRIAKLSQGWDFTVFYPWDGLAIRGTNSSVAAKGCRRIKIKSHYFHSSVAANGCRKIASKKKIVKETEFPEMEQA